MVEKHGGGEELSYFELNLETWRQLWRVLEMADVVLLITDIRHPVGVILHIRYSVSFLGTLYIFKCIFVNDCLFCLLFQALHFSPALYEYVTKQLKKHLILVLNKIDLATPSLVVAWKHYFQERFPDLHIVCFTSFPKDKQEQEEASKDPGKGTVCI